MSQLIARFVRRFSTFKPQSKPTQFDVAKEIREDVLVFKNEKSTKTLKLACSLAAVNAFIWLVPSYSGLRYIDDLADLSRRRKKWKEQGKCETEYWEYLVDFMHKYKKIGFVILQTVAFSGFFFVAFYSMRSIRKMSILKGGEKVSLETWLPIPLEDYSNQMVIPVKNISAVNTRTGDNPYVKLKLKGFPFYFIMDKKNGQFTQPLIFDKAIALSRQLKVK